MRHINMRDLTGYAAGVYTFKTIMDINKKVYKTPSVNLFPCASALNVSFMKFLKK